MMENPRALTIMNDPHGCEEGFTIVWGPEEDNEIKKIIQAKIDNGSVFYLVIPTLEYKKLVPSKKVVLNPDLVGDENLRNFLLSTYAQVVNNKKNTFIGVVRSTEAGLIAESQSLCIEPIKKGRH